DVRSPAREGQVPQQVVEGAVLHHQDDDMVNLLQIGNEGVRAHNAASPLEADRSAALRPACRPRQAIRGSLCQTPGCALASRPAHHPPGGDDEPAWILARCSWTAGT